MSLAAIASAFRHVSTGQLRCQFGTLSMRYFTSVATAELGTSDAVSSGFDSSDFRLSPDRAQMLSKFWKLRQNALNPELCLNQSRLIAEFNSLQKVYGYCPVDFHLKLQYFCGKGSHENVLETLKDIKKAGIACDVSTFNMVLHSLAEDPKYESSCRSILSQMISFGVSPDGSSFTAAFKAHINAKNASGIITLLGSMLQRGFFPPTEQTNAALSLFCDEQLLDETQWLLQVLMHSPFSTVNPDVACRIVQCFGAQAPSETILKHMSNLRIEPTEELLDNLLQIFAENDENTRMINMIKSSGTPPCTVIDSTSKAPALPKALMDIHSARGAARARSSRSPARRDNFRQTRHRHY